MPDDIKFPNPLYSEQRKLLKELSSFAKEQCLLEGNQRRILYICGNYDEWFDTSFDSLIKALKDLLDECPENGNTYRTEIEEIINDVAAVDTSYGGYLYAKVIEEDASREERLLCAEHLENKGQKEEALKIAKGLKKEYPQNETIKKMIERLQKRKKASVQSQKVSKKKEKGLPEALRKAIAARKKRKSDRPQKDTPKRKIITHPKNSIQVTHIICLECGESFKEISPAHLKSHGLNSREYRVKYGFSLNQPLCAKSLSENNKKRILQSKK